ncbi:MAG: 2-isopropylmalate synthase [Candidatus Bipolaricaulia bacterium]
MTAESEIEIGEVQIFDTTLRDGEQTPGVGFSVAEKVKVARKLEALGIDVIEAGFPINSEEERESVCQIADAVSITVCSLARVVDVDIDAAIDCGVDMVHVFVPTSEVQMTHAIHANRYKVIERTRQAIQRIKDADLICMYSPMDATRTDPDFLIEICQVAEEAGVDWINLPDTVGVSTPQRIAAMVDGVRTAVQVPISIHCHNDFGLAVSNTLAAVEAGATMVQVAMNGIGERAGNASLEQTVMGLHCLYDAKLAVKTEKLYELSRFIERLTGIPTPPYQPIIGANAFSHESGIHAAGVLEESSTFEPGIMTPEMVGHRRRLVIGKHTGKHSVQIALNEASLHPTEDELNEIVKRVKSLGGKGKHVTQTDLFAIAESVMAKVPKGQRAIELDQIVVTTGNRTTPTASVVARVHGETRTEAQLGVGPVDAALQAVQRILGNTPAIEITDFHLDAISGGSDAVATVSITVEDESGKHSSAQAAHEDIVIASVEALMAAINQLIHVHQSVAETVN